MMASIRETTDGGQGGKTGRKLIGYEKSETIKGYTSSLRASSSS